jgi:hypothetical protein
MQLIVLLRIAVAHSAIHHSPNGLDSRLPLPVANAVSC